MFNVVWRPHNQYNNATRSLSAHLQYNSTSHTIWNRPFLFHFHISYQIMSYIYHRPPEKYFIFIFSLKIKFHLMTFIFCHQVGTFNVLPSSFSFSVSFSSRSSSEYVKSSSHEDPLLKSSAISAVNLTSAAAEFIPIVFKLFLLPLSQMADSM